MLNFVHQDHLALHNPWAHAPAHQNLTSRPATTRMAPSHTPMPQQPGMASSYSSSPQQPNTPWVWNSEHNSMLKMVCQCGDIRCQLVNTNPAIPLRCFDGGWIEYLKYVSMEKTILWESPFPRRRMKCGFSIYRLLVHAHSKNILFHKTHVSNMVQTAVARIITGWRDTNSNFAFVLNSV